MKSFLIKHIQSRILMIFTLVMIFFANSMAIGQKDTVVPENIMQEIYQQVQTPYKYGLVIVPSDNSKKLDCPTVFRKGNSWYMTYLVFTGRGYETWLAKSANLLDWQTTGKLLSFTDSIHWDGNQKAGYIGLLDPEWNGSYAPEKYKGKYWMPYFGGSVAGYEAGLLSLGMAFTKKKPETPHEWQRLSNPILSSEDADKRWWENKKQFKPTVIRDKERLTGHEFVLYYNANGDSAINNIKTRWYERIGMAVSDDMVHWKRYGEEPIVHHPKGITGDPVFQKIGDVWVMFYFGAFWEGRKDAFNRFACSYDLVHWTDWQGADLINSTEDYDKKFAHKSFVVRHEGVTYHFYCAVNDKDQRGIAVATSVDKGKSKINFVAAE